MKINIAEALNAAKIKKVATSLTSLYRKQPSVRGIVDRMKNGVEPSSKEILSLKKDIQDEVVMAFAKEFGPEETMKKFKVVIDEAKLQKSKDDPCWDSHVQLGTKKKNGKEVPNCVPKEEVELDEASGERGFKDKSVASKGGSTSSLNRWENAYRKLNVELEKAKKAGDTKKVAALNKKKDDMMDKRYPMGEEVELDEAKMDKSHPIAKEYQSLKKMDIKALRNLIKQQKKVVDTSEYKTKDHAISSYLRDKHGHKEVDKVFGFKEEVELDEANVHDRYMRAHGKKATGQGRWAFTTSRNAGSQGGDNFIYRGDFNDAHKAAKKHFNSKEVYVMEQTDLDEGASPMIKPPTNTFSTKKDAFEYKRKHGGKVMMHKFTNPRTGQTTTTFKVVQEETDQIDELSKNTLIKYAKKSNKDLDKRGPDDDKSINRETGLSRATKSINKKGGIKMTDRIRHGIKKGTFYGVKEETELDEKLDKDEYHIDVAKGEFKTYKNGNKKYKYLYDLEKKNGDGDGPMLVTIQDLKKANKIAAKYGGKVSKTEIGTYRIVKEEAELSEVSAKLARRAAAASQAKAYTAGSGYQNPEQEKDANRLDRKSQKAMSYIKKRQGEKGVKKTNRLAGKMLGFNEETDTSEKLEMAQTQLHFIGYACDEILEFIEMGGEVEEWYQNKLSKVHSDMEGLHSYIEGEMRRTGMKEEVEIDEASYKVPTNYAAMMLKKKKAQQKAAAKEKWGKDDADYLKKHIQKEEVELDEATHAQIKSDMQKELSKMSDSQLKAKAAELKKSNPSDLNRRLIANDVISAEFKKRGMKEEVELDEVLDKNADAGEYVKDFEKSDAPQFKGKTKEKRRQMAIAAYMSKKK